MKKFIFTKEKAWLEKWDNFVSNNPKGSHLVHSDWLKSYKSYGFDFEVGLVLDNNRIVGGYGAVIPKFLLFKFYIIPHGPIYDANHNLYLGAHVSQIKDRAKAVGACYLQLSMPISSNELISEHVYKPQDVTFLNDHFKKGKLFKYVYSTYGLNWVGLKNENEEGLLNSFKSNTRRDIRAGIRKHDSFKLLTEASDIKMAYRLCEQNAKQQGYALRSWNDFNATVLELVRKGIAHFIGVFNDGDQKGTIFIVKSGGFYTYIFGGTKREHPNLLSGYVLQWEALKMSLDKELVGYNISIGGSTGVQEFKSKFGTVAIPYENPHYHMILNKFWFAIYSKTEKNIKPFKKRISKTLSFFSR